MPATKTPPTKALQKPKLQSDHFEPAPETVYTAEVQVSVRLAVRARTMEEAMEILNGIVPPRESIRARTRQGIELTLRRQ